MPESLSLKEAQKLILHSQGLPVRAQNKGKAEHATLSAIQRLGYVQIDTISVIERAHHHTLWNRNPRYQPHHIDTLLKSKDVFEYWSHAAAYLPMRDYRFSLVRKNALSSGRQQHWFERDVDLMTAVKKRIEQEGPMMARDFDAGGNKTGYWSSKPSKKALENLFMQGELMIPYRRNFQKVYELTERVIPSHIETREPTPKEYARHLIQRFLQANGLGDFSEFCYLLKNTKPLVTAEATQMLKEGELIELIIQNKNEETYVALPESLELLERPLARSRLKILSPFDNLLIQRKRALAFFDFDYQIECYVPEKKRKYGYFVLPILWDGKLVARMDCKVERQSSTLHILNLELEPKLKKLDAFADAFWKELPLFMEFNSCETVIVSKNIAEKHRSIFHFRDLS